MDHSTIIRSIEIFTVLFVFAEILYSYYTHDGVYSIPSTVGNFLNGIVLKLISLKIDAISFVYLGVLFSLLHYSYSPFSIVSLVYCLLIFDFFYYLLHRMKHSVSFFWMFHFVHHSDHKFNMSTYMRASWIEHLYMQSIPLFVVLLLGFNPSIIGLAVFCSFIYQFFCHSQYIRLPKFFDLIFITPSLHKIHHDQAMKNQMSNFATMFSIWDRLFGTYVGSIEKFTAGIEGYQQDNFIKVQTDPIIKYSKGLL